MVLGRSELEAMSREQLVEKAQTQGLRGAETLTRVELIDEILRAVLTDEKAQSEARGLLGKARDLVARVMEKGLHLPQAAGRTLSEPPAAVLPVRELPPLPTVALAEVYAAQGHSERALGILKQILAQEPEHPLAIKLQKRLIEQRQGVASAPAMPSAPPAAAAPSQPKTPVLDSLRLERQPDGSMQVSFVVRPASYASRRSRLPSGRLVVRLATVRPHWNGPETIYEDHPVQPFAGTLVLEPGADTTLCGLALGWGNEQSFEVLAVADIA